MAFVSPVTVWLSEVEVDEMGVQVASKALVPSFLMYSQPVITPLPVTEALRVRLPPPAVAAVGVVGLPGLVRNAVATASSVEQPLSLYTL